MPKTTANAIRFIHSLPRNFRAPMLTLHIQHSARNEKPSTRKAALASRGIVNTIGLSHSALAALDGLGAMAPRRAAMRHEACFLVSAGDNRGVERMRRTILLLAMMCCSGAGANARDLGQWGSVDPALREWYQALMQPD